MVVLLWEQLRAPFHAAERTKHLSRNSAEFSFLVTAAPAELPSGCLSAPTWRCHGCKGCSKGLELTRCFPCFVSAYVPSPRSSGKWGYTSRYLAWCLLGVASAVSRLPASHLGAGLNPAIRTRVNAATCWKPHGPAASRQLLRRMLKEDSKKKQDRWNKQISRYLKRDVCNGRGIYNGRKFWREEKPCRGVWLSILARLLLSSTC